MIHRVVPILLASLILVVGLVCGDEPPGDKGDAPLRLKRKKRDGEPPAAQKDKETRRQGDKEKENKKEKEKEKEEEPLVPEDGRPVEEVDEKEVIERIGRNMRSVEEKLGNRELGEPTSQQLRDIIRDIDSLIRKSEQQSGGGGGEQQQQNQQDQQDQQDQQGGGAQKQQRQQAKQGQSGGKRQMARNGKRQRRELRSERGGKQKSGRQMAGNQGPGRQEQKPMPQEGMNPGGGGNSKSNPRDINSEMYKDHWGHLPESLRAEMNAYSNPQPFMPRYDRLIREYYKTIAEQGRKKGD
jgi:hypothetical protein